MILREDTEGALIPKDDMYLCVRTLVPGQPCYTGPGQEVVLGHLKKPVCG